MCGNQTVCEVRVCNSIDEVILILKNHATVAVGCVAQKQSSHPIDNLAATHRCEIDEVILILKNHATVAVGCVALYNPRIRSTIWQRRTGAK
jgi:hypothetical protein